MYKWLPGTADNQAMQDAQSELSSESSAYMAMDPYSGPTNSNNFKADIIKQDMTNAYDWKKMEHQEEWSKYELDRQIEALKRNGINPYYMFSNSAAGSSGSAPSGGVGTSTSANGKSGLPTLIAAGVAIAKLVATVAAAV